MGYPNSLREDHWERIKGSLLGKADDVGRSIKRRLSPEAAPVRPIHIAPWCSLPCVYGRWSGIHQRFRRWACPSGIV